MQKSEDYNLLTLNLGVASRFNFVGNFLG